MEKLTTIEQKIRHELEIRPECRESDWALMFHLYLDFYGIDSKSTFFDVCVMHNQMDLPSPESISRLRRKVQEHNPELRSEDQVREWRKDREIEMYDYVQQ